MSAFFSISKKLRWAALSLMFIASQFGPLALLPSVARASSVPVNGCSFDQTGAVWTLESSCTSTAEIDIPAGVTLEGNGYTITPAFPKDSGTSTFAAIGALANNVTIQNLTVSNGAAGIGLHGINVFAATGVSISNVVVENFNSLYSYGIVINGSVVSVSNVTTTGNFAGINVDLGSSVVGPATLNIVGPMSQSETYQIYVDNTTKDVHVNDVLSQYFTSHPGFQANDLLYTLNPSTPAITAPANNALLTAAQLTQIDWSDSASVITPVTYEYRVYSNPGYSSLLYAQDGLTSSAIPTPGTPDGIYYVQVQAKDALGHVSPWSNDANNPYKITVDSTAPEMPVHIAPADNSTVTTFDTTADFNFSWTAVTDTNGPVTYEWEASYAADVVGPGDAFISQLAVHTGLTNPTVFSPGTPLGTYYWHVRAVDAAGNKSAWTDPWNVTVKQVFQPTLTLKKIAINDNGGATLSNQFELFANGTKLSDGSTTTDGDTTTTTYVVPNVTAQEYTLSETAVDGYSASPWSCTGNDSLDDNQITLNVDENVVCEITNNDIPPALTLVKKLGATYGSNAKLSDWLLNATGTTQQSPTNLSGKTGTPNASSGSNFKTDTYAFSESGPAGFTAEWSCINNQTQESEIVPAALAISLGQSYTCTVTNTAIQPKITVFKHVDNGNTGSTKVASDFTMNVLGSNVSDGSFPGDENGTTVTLNAGFYSVYESPKSGYLTTYSGQCGGLFQRINVGETKECTVKNTAITPRLSLFKIAINDNGGSSKSSDWTLTATPNNETAPTISGNGLNGVVNVPAMVNVTYTLSESGPAGYEAGKWHCIGGNLNGNTLTLELGKIVACYVTNNDIAPKLTLHKEVINNNSGESKSSDWTLTATPDSDYAKTISGNGEDGVYQQEAVANVAYTLTEEGPEGYSASGWECSGGNLDGNVLTLTLDEDVTCTITNDDIAHPAISVEKYGPATAYEGDEVTYTFYVTNIGDTYLENISLFDDVTGEVTCDASSLSKGDYTTCYATYTIPANTTDDVFNTVEACGTYYPYSDKYIERLWDSEEGGTNVCANATHNLDVLHPAIHVVKSGPSSAKIGDTITYTFTVTNPGDEPLDSITVSDDIAGSGVYVSGDTNANGVLETTETWIYTANYTIPANAGSQIVNTVTATGSELASVDESETIVSRLLKVNLSAFGQRDPRVVTVSDTASHTLTVEHPAELVNTGGPATASIVIGSILLLGALVMSSPSRHLLVRNKKQ